MTRHRPYRPQTERISADMIRVDTCDTRRFMNPSTGISPAHCTALGHRAVVPPGHDDCGGTLPYRALAPVGAGGSPTNVHCTLYIVHCSTYTFSAKERDLETGLYYFGSRYYSSDLSIWLSVDPMSDKYASLSPYVYCANNPVKLEDPNGEHFEVVIEDNTITIKATYYAADDDKALLQQGIDFWKQQSGKYSYVMENGESYTINFDLSIAEGSYSNSFEAKSAVKTQTSMNYFEILQNVLDEDKNPIRGKCNVGFGIEVSSDYTLAGYNPARTAAHEIGHTLGCADTFLQDDLMESGGNGSTIGINNIRAIMLEAGFSNCGYANIGNNDGKCVKSNVVGAYFGKVVKNQ